jgi:hypothetical protein
MESEMDRNTWISKVNAAARAGDLTWAQARCLYLLQTFRGPGGLFPSHEAIAARGGAGCSVSTVQRALNAARDLGLVRWAERWVRIGWRRLRTSNLYELLDPENPMKPTAGQPDRVTLRVKISSLFSAARDASRGVKDARERHAEEQRVMIEAARGLPDLLAARRAAVDASWRHALRGKLV